jgi:D-alanyl-D-alanine carboxypeptidase
MHRCTHKKISIVFIILTLIAGSWVLINKQRQQKDDQPGSKTASFNKKQHSLTDPSSIWVIVNKRSSLPAAYTPAPLVIPNVPLRNQNGREMQLREDAAKATEQLVAAAKQAGHNLILVSGYRSYDLQAVVYDSFVRRDGQAKADTYSARPGHSEHQTGLAADFGTNDHICELEMCFGSTAAGKWLVENAAKYGFILRYPSNKEKVVGYEYEPWHFR